MIDITDWTYEQVTRRLPMQDRALEQRIDSRTRATPEPPKAARTRASRMCVFATTCACAGSSVTVEMMEERQIPVAGGQLWTVRQGNGPAVLLCHGGPGLWGYLAPVAET